MSVTWAASCGSGSFASLLTALGDRFGTRALDGSAFAPLEDGEFVALLDRAVFAPDGGLELARHGEQQIVRGRISP